MDQWLGWFWRNESKVKQLCHHNRQNDVCAKILYLFLIQCHIHYAGVYCNNKNSQSTLTKNSPHQQMHFPGRHNQASLLFSLLWSCLTLTLLLYQTWFEVLGKGLCYYHCGERRWWWYSWFGLVEAERGQRMASAEQTQHCTVALIAKFYPQIIADFVDLRDWDILLDLKSDVYYRF